MQRIFIFLSFIFISAAGYSQFLVDPELNPQQLYNEMGLKDQINYTAFQQALDGYQKIGSKNREIITLIDFTKPSTTKRLYVLDLRHKKLLFSTHVSHGRNSGENYATSFSNQNGSNKSSLGFFVTEGTYQGKNGYSLILDGLEKGINDKAKERAIVIHGADYSDPAMLATAKRLGRSLGCPALPRTVSKKIIDVIKNGSLLYIFADDSDYTEQSKILKTT